MSERGSFVTQYVYCAECLLGLQEALSLHDPSKYLTTRQVESWEPRERLPILAGKVGELVPGGEREVFSSELRPAIEAAICHPVRIAVIPEKDGAECVLRFDPQESE